MHFKVGLCRISVYVALLAVTFAFQRELTESGKVLALKGKLNCKGNAR